MSKSKRRVRRPFDRVGTPIEQFEPSRTKQSFLGECNINNILARYHVTGLMRQVPGQPRYLDCTQLPIDYQAALNAVLSAEHAFSQISSDIRAQFDNDPSAFVAFCADPSNLDQLREWNLAPPAEPVVPPAADSAAEAPEAPEGDSD